MLGYPLSSPKINKEIAERQLAMPLNLMILILLFNIEGKCSAIQSGKPKAIISLLASDSHAVTCS